MNGKQAKRIRRLAMGLATTFDQNGRKIHPNGYVVQEHKASSLSSSSAAVQPADPAPEPSQYTIHNRPDSLRQIYRTIKKGIVYGKVS